MQCPQCLGKGEIIESLFDRRPCDWCHGVGEVPDPEPEVEEREEDKAVVTLFPEDLDARLRHARWTGIRDCQSALLRYAVDLTVSTVRSLKEDDESLSKEEKRLRMRSPSERKDAILALYSKLVDVEGWAWNADDHRLRCRHEPKEACLSDTEELLVCMDCGTVLECKKRPPPEPKLKTEVPF